MIGRVISRIRGDGTGGALKFAGVEFSYWFAMSVGNYMTVFLQNLGFPASQVGIVNALNSAVGIFATPFWGMMGDKIRSVRKVFVITLACQMILFLLIPASAEINIFGFSLAMAWIPLVCFFRNPAMSLLDNWVVQSSYSEGFNYGTIRAFGSLSFAIIGIILSFVLPGVGVDCTFYLSPVLLLPVLLLSLTMRDREKTEKRKSLSFKEMQVGSLFKSYRYVTFLVFAFFLCMSTNSCYGFLSYLLEDVGASASQLGLLTGYRALLEVPGLMLMAVLSKSFSFRKMLIASGVFFAAEVICFGFAENLVQVILFSTFNGLGNGLFIASVLNYIYSVSPQHLKATAQTIYGAVSSLAGILGNIAGGILIDFIGIKGFYISAGMLILFAVSVFLVFNLLGDKLQGVQNGENE